MHGSSVEDSFAAIDAEAGASEPSRLIDFLEESHPVYLGRTPGEVGWIRGRVFTMLGRRELPEESIPHILEQFETGHDALVVACAARAMRSASPRTGLGRHLRRAILNIRQRDRILNLSDRRGMPGNGNDTTAMDELLSTAIYSGRSDPGIALMLDELLGNEELAFSAALKARLQAARDQVDASSGRRNCCDTKVTWTGLLKLVRANFRDDPLTDLRVQDQEGHECTFGEFSGGRPVVVTFFYTRCDNPAKCSLTISRLAELQRMIAAEPWADDVCLAAFTYDDAYDSSFRLAAYGKNRGFEFGANARFFRVTEEFDRLRKVFALGVNFVGSVVNHHRIEVFVLGRNGRPCGTLQRFQWEPVEVLALVKDAVISPKGGVYERAKNIFRPLLAVFPYVLFALMPKCPFCFAAWASAFGFSWLNMSPKAFDWMKALLAVMIACHLVWMGCRARRSQSWMGFVLCAAGFLLVAIGGNSGTAAVTIIGAILIGVGGTVSSPGSSRSARLARA